MKRLSFLASLLLLGALSTSAQERQPSWLVRTGETPQDAPYENRPTFTPAVRGAVSYSLGHWSFCLESFFCHYGFRGSEVAFTVPSTDRESRLATRGAFEDFTVKAKFNLHF